MTIDADDKVMTTGPVVLDIHTQHCCARHGCKYGPLTRAECTVESGEKPQSYMCEVCYDAIGDDWEMIQFANELFDRGYAAGLAVVTFE